MSSFLGDLIGKTASFYLRRTLMEAGKWKSYEEWIVTGAIRGIYEVTWFVEVHRAARAKPGDLLSFKLTAKDATIRVSLTDHPAVQSYTDEVP